MIFCLTNLFKEDAKKSQKNDMRKRKLRTATHFLQFFEIFPRILDKNCDLFYINTIPLWGI